MRLLILTQKLDKNDDILGFFHRWVEEFAKRCESVVVICLQKGDYDLPENVKVLSLGKEKNVRHSVSNKIGYARNFLRYIISERKNYDSVFVHMNPEYIVLGGLFWKLWGKKINLWYNHKKGGTGARIAATFSQRIFHTSPFAFTARFKKSEIMPAGIDTEEFKIRNPKHEIRNNINPPRRTKFKILSLGRISPVKDIDILIKALNLLDKKGVDFSANIYGDPAEKDKEYYNKMKEMARSLEEKGKIVFRRGVPAGEAPEIYNQHEIFINLTQTGSFDKTILEAMACEMPVIVSNKSFEAVLPEQFLFEEKNAEDLANKIEAVLNLPREEKLNYGKKFREYVVENHNLEKLIYAITR